MEEEKKISYTDFPDFNEWLDNDENNTVIISGFSFPPSDTLYKMNYGQYCEILEEYLADDEVLLKEVYTEFPTPIAYYLHQAEENYDSPHHRLGLLKSAWEALVFVIFGIVVSEARHRSFPLKDLGINLKDYYSDRLAQKLSIVENILDYCYKNSFQFRCADIISLNAISIMRELNRKRNEFAHSFEKSPEQQKELYEELKPEFFKVLKEVRDLQKVNLFRYHSNGEGGALFPRCDIFNGHSLNGAKKILKINRDDYMQVIDYFNNKAIFVHIGGDFFCSSPFIHFQIGQDDSHTTLLFYKQKIGQNYLFEMVSRSKQIELEKIVFEDRDNELRTLVI